MTNKRIALITTAVLLTAARNRLIAELRQPEDQPTTHTPLAPLLISATTEIAVTLGISAARHHHH
ncbi:hypothetical protein ABT160_29825 [Streptomyces sp. NPDC001941]|uniref:hypothetical protein n=1 Tax=Streptomyces sp. NPDC001941 TaxID=3154659 RepID=UPI003316F003